MRRVRSIRIAGAGALCAAAASFVLTLGPGTHALAGTATVSGCTKADLTNAISAAGAGGTVDYVVDCTGAQAVPIGSAVSISASVTIDGNGHAVVLDGGNNSEIINVSFNVILHLNQLTFQNANWSSGGAIDNVGSTVDVSNSTFAHNVAAAGGAIQSSSVISGSTVFAPVLTVTNSTFDDNTGTRGSAIVATGTTNIANSTFVGNSGSTLVVAGTTTLTNTVLAQSGSPDCSGTITDAGGNLADDASCGFSGAGSRNSVTDASLHLGALAGNGGPTQTNALQTGSVAIDFTTGCPTADQRGVTRFDNSESKCDSGAYEFQDPLPLPTPAPTPAPTAIPVPVTGGQPAPLGSGAVLLVMGAALAGTASFAARRAFRRGTR